MLKKTFFFVKYDQECIRDVKRAGSALEFHFYNDTKEMKKDRLQLMLSPTRKTITLFMNQALHSPKWDLFLTFNIFLKVFFLPPLISFRGNFFLLLLHGSKMNYLKDVNTDTTIFPVSGGKIYS